MGESIRSRRDVLISLAGATSVILSGCRKGKRKSSTSAAGAATAPAASAAPPATLPAESRLLIDGYPVRFPAPHLRLQGASPLTMSLFSDQGGPTGNAYYFDISIEGVEDISGLNGALWQLSTSEDRTDDLLTTIQIDGGAQQLQPQELSVTFSVSGQRVRAKLSGRWGLFSRSDALLPERAVLVTGEIVALIEAV